MRDRSDSGDGARAGPARARAGRRWRAAVVAACALVAAGVAASCRGSGPDWRVSQLWGGPTSIDVLTAPATVEAFRLDPSNPAKSKDGPRVGDFAVTAGPVAVDEATARELSAVFLDPDTYDWLRAKGCDFTPGVGLRFVREASRVEVVLCFACDELMIFRHGRRIGMEDFDAARPRLVAVAKRLFPDDAAIQALR